MSDAESSYPPPAPSAADHAFYARRAAARRAEFLAERNLRGLDSDDSAVISMCRQLREDWADHRVRSRVTNVRYATDALNRITTRYSRSGPPLPLCLEAFGSGFSAYGPMGTSRVVLITQHADQLGPEQIRELADFVSAGFDVLLTPERWVSRMGFRLMVSNPIELPLVPPPEPDPEYRPGRSFRPKYVSLRSNLTADTVRTPSHVPMESHP